LRHQALNELTGIGALLYRVRTRLGGSVALGGRSSMGELTPLFDSMEARLHGAPARLGFRFLPAPAAATRTELSMQARSLLEELGVKATVHCERPAHAAIAAEELEVALGCLVENSLESLALAGNEGELALQVEMRGDRWGIEVRDDGIGVDPAAFEHLFDPFFSTHPGRAGLGLKIARRIAHRWGGELLLARREPSGLSVVMLVPTAEAV
jgi:light-regulated signal transduction histidine kinase (bacteriophytochrome)